MKTEPALARALYNENKKLKQIVKQMSLCARRYCDYRQSYATGAYNDLVRQCLLLGIELDTSDGIIWARDAMGRAFDQLSDSQAVEGTPEALGEI